MENITKKEALREIAAIQKELKSSLDKKIFKFSNKYSSSTFLRSMFLTIPYIGSSIDILLSNPSNNIKDKYYQKTINAIIDYLGVLANNIENIADQESPNTEELKKIIESQLKKETTVIKIELEKIIKESQQSTKEIQSKVDNIQLQLNSTIEDIKNDLLNISPPLVNPFGSLLDTEILDTSKKVKALLHIAFDFIDKENYLLLTETLEKLKRCYKNVSVELQNEIDYLEILWCIGRNDLNGAESIIKNINIYHLSIKNKLRIASFFLFLRDVKMAKSIIEQIPKELVENTELQLLRDALLLLLNITDKHTSGDGRISLKKKLNELLDKIEQSDYGNKSLFLLLIDIAIKLNDFEFVTKLVQDFEDRFGESIISQHLQSFTNFYTLKFNLQKRPDRNLSKIEKEIIEHSISSLEKCLFSVKEKKYLSQEKSLKMNLSVFYHLKASFSTGKVRKDFFKKSASALEGLNTINKSFQTKSKIANAYLYAGEYEIALRLFSELSPTLDNSDIKTNANYVSVLLINGKVQMAIELLEKLLKQKSISWTILANVGVILLVTGEILYSIKIFKAARTLAKADRWRINYLLSKSYKVLKNHVEAEQCLRMAIEQRSFNPFLYKDHFETFKLGTCHNLYVFISQMEQKFKNRGFHEEIIFELKEQIKHSLSLYAKTIQIYGSKKAVADTLITQDFADALEKSDLLKNKLNAFNAITLQSQNWTGHDTLEQVKDIILGNYEESLNTFFVDNDTTVTNKIKDPQNFKPTLLAACRELEKNGLSFHFRNESIIVLNQLINTPKDTYIISHALNIIARKIEDDFSEPLQCYNFTQDIEDRGFQRRAVYKVFNKMYGRAILADEVGLGKTIEACLLLTEYLNRNLIKRCLILVPTTSLILQWFQELKYKFLLFKNEKYDVCIYKAKNWIHWSAHTVCISTYSSAVKNRHELNKIKWDMVICDEAHHLRNRSSQSFKLIAKTSSRYLLLLTATPIHKGLEDLYSLATLVRPSLFGTLKKFKSDFRIGKKGKILNLTKLNVFLSQIMIHNTLIGTASELPSSRREFVNVDVNLTIPEINYYKEVVTYILSEAKKDEKLPLAYYVIARAASSNPQTVFKMLKNINKGKDEYLESNLLSKIQNIKANSKIEQLKKIKQIEGSKNILVFVEFKQTAIEVSKALEAEVIYGGMSNLDKTAILNKIKKSPKHNILVATPSLSEGLNLEFCSVLVNFDLPWNPMKIEQRIGRIQRPGQTEKVIYIYSLASDGTIEVSIRDGLIKKVKMHEQIFGQIKLSLSSEDIGKGIESKIFEIFKKAKNEKMLRENIANFFDSQVKEFFIESDHFLDLINFRSV